jgi:hypothetical protein
MSEEMTMTYKGHVENGVVVLDGPDSLPDGTEVRIEPVEPRDAYRSLREGLRKFAGIVKGMPKDMARNHDHYLHGAPRK